ncbi:MAG: type II secretion system protein [bacterium]
MFPLCPSGRHGFTLAGMAVLLVVIAIAAPPLFVMLRQALEDNAHLNATRTAAGLASGLMDEVLSKHFEDPELGAGSFGAEEGARVDYDDVDDYDGLNEKPPADGTGEALDDFAHYRTRVTIENVAPNDPGGAARPDGTTDLKRVTVRVLWADGHRSVQLVGLRGNHDAPGSIPQPGLTFLSRQGSGNDDLRFQFANNTGETIYLTHLTLTWSAPSAYYSCVKLKVLGHTNYGTVWHNLYHNRIRAGSGEVAMFNAGDVVAIPPARNVRVTVKDFRSSPQWPLGTARDVSDSAFTAEFWAAPTRYQPMTVPSQ